MAALGGLALGLRVGVALERALVRSDLSRADPEAGEAFGKLRGRAASVTAPDGTRLHLEELGSGPCLVFAHGLALTQDAWHYQRRDLPASFRCVFYDLRGHGRSGRSPREDYSLAALARDLEAVLAWTGEERVAVVAHSLSGMAALKLAELAPEALQRRVAGLVLVSTTYADALAQLAAAAAGGPARVQRALAGALAGFIRQDPARANRLRGRGTDLGYLGTRLFGFGERPSPSQVAFIDGLLAGVDPGVWVRTFPSVTGFDLSAVLERLPVPALVLAGDRDRLTSPADARHMAARIPRARLVLLPGAGHAAFMERWQDANREIAAFAKEVLQG